MPIGGFDWLAAWQSNTDVHVACDIQSVNKDTLNIFFKEKFLMWAFLKSR